MSGAVTALDQIAALALAADRPLIVTDADEVLFAFMADFEPWIEARGYCFDWSSYALNGNIRRRRDDAAADVSEIVELLDGFFINCTANMAVVPGAADALAALSQRAQIVVLSNVSDSRYRDRRRALVHRGMDYPLVTNAGPKGPAVSALAGRVRAPVFFIDDSPPHHESVARHAGEVRRLHMIADPRLARMLSPAKDSHHRVDDWSGARAIIEAELAAAGY